MGGMVETYTATATPDINARWRVCLHEASHAVAGRHVFKQTTRAAVFSNDSGVADTGSGAGVPISFKGVLVTAAGHAAEHLARAYPPPQVALPVPLELTYPEHVKPLKEQLRQSLPDAVAIARWCIGGIEKQPERWANRFHWIHREARLFVVRHQREIVEVATGLFARGIITLPA